MLHRAAVIVAAEEGCHAAAAAVASCTEFLQRWTFGAERDAYTCAMADQGRVDGPGKVGDL